MWLAAAAAGPLHAGTAGRGGRGGAALSAWCWCPKRPPTQSKGQMRAAGEQPAYFHQSARVLASVASLLRMKSLDFPKLACKAVK